MLSLVETTQVRTSEIRAVITDERADNEIQRLAAVKRYDILDTPPDSSFDRITALAADLFNVPVSLISIVDRDRVWLKSHHGMDATELGRDPGLCASAILSVEPWILTDAKTDMRSFTNPLVSGEFGLRFYFGVPLRTSDGHNLGMLCVIDREPRQVGEQQGHHLQNLAAVVMDQMELRLSARRAAAKAKILASEIDHRMMNSLQFISGLLNMQSRAVSTSEAADQLKIAADRVSAVGRVHRQFSFDEVEDRVPLLAYLRRLCGELADAMEANIEVDGIEASVPTTQILAIGLVINELITNAKKYGGGSIRVTFAPGSSGQYQLSVADEGEGLPEGFTLDRNGGGLGMKVVTALASQLEGLFSAGPNPTGRGACFAVTFPGQ